MAEQQTSMRTKRGSCTLLPVMTRFSVAKSAKPGETFLTLSGLTRKTNSFVGKMLRSPGKMHQRFLKQRFSEASTCAFRPYLPKIKRGGCGSKMGSQNGTLVNGTHD